MTDAEILVGETYRLSSCCDLRGRGREVRITERCLAGFRFEYVSPVNVVGPESGLSSPGYTTINEGWIRAESLEKA